MKNTRFVNLLTSLFTLFSGCKSKSIFGLSIFNKQGCCAGDESVHETSIESLV